MELKVAVGTTRLRPCCTNDCNAGSPRDMNHRASRVLDGMQLACRQAHGRMDMVDSLAPLLGYRV
jgi:hypothetical protein